MSEESNKNDFLDYKSMTIQEMKELAAANLMAIKRLEESQEKTGRYLETVTKNLNDLGTKYGRLSNNIGSDAENFFFRGLEASKKIASIDLDTIDRNVKCWNNEYDIVGINGKSVVLVSVKHILRKNQVEKFVNKELKQFIKDFPQYKKHKIYRGVAGRDVQKAALDEAIKSGLFVLTQSGKDIKLLNAKTFKPKSV